jgi:hypothetical protein
MPTREEYAALPLPQRLERLRRTPDDLAAALRGRAEADVSRRPGATSWSAKEVVCHLRDIEELCMLRFRMMLAIDEPKVFVAGARPRNPEEWGLVGEELAIDPDRWAEERQYQRADLVAVLAAFGRRRAESLGFFRRLSTEQWQRTCLHPTLGRLTYADWAAIIAGHDDNHLAQLQRALDGRP